MAKTKNNMGEALRVEVSAYASPTKCPVLTYGIGLLESDQVPGSDRAYAPAGVLRHVWY